MKMLALAVTFVGALFLVSGCGSHGDHADHADHAAASPQPDAHEHGEAVVELALNDGEKWQVDDHTRGAASRLTEIVEVTAPIDSVDDARVLGSAIDAEIATLIQGCTMTGPAHDQLHVFLVEVFPRVEELKTAEDLDGLRQVQTEMGALLDAYDRHFE